MKKNDDQSIERVRELFKQATERIIIVSAFISSHALERLLEGTPTNISKTVYVRWRMQDLLCRATDPEIFEVCKRNQVQLFQHSALHAKAYIADGHALVGSANATRLGLGMIPRSNLELLVPVDANSPWVESLMLVLKKEALAAVEVSIEQLDKFEIEEQATDFDLKPDYDWVPRSNYNDTVAFIQQGTWNQLAADDCIALGLPAGASENEIKQTANNTEVLGQFMSHIQQKTISLDKNSLSRWLEEFSGDSKYRDTTLCFPMISWLHECSRIYVQDHETSDPKMTPWLTSTDEQQ